MSRLAERQWQTEYGHSVRGALQQAKELTPAPLYETGPTSMPNHVCLACGKRPVFSTLRTSSSQEPVVLLCRSCSVDWNFYGYNTLKRIRPKSLIWQLSKWFLANPFKRYVVWNDLRRFLNWQRSMAGLRKRMKAMGR